MQTCLRLALLAAALGAASCSSPGQAPGLRGYGTPDVSTYMPADQATGVQAMLDRCAQAPRLEGPRSETQGLAVACSQLHRTLRNQPGNTVPGPAL